jgi:hypothetical protein
MIALKIGRINKVDMVSWTNKEGKTFNKVFIHIDWDRQNPEVESITERLNAGKDIKIIYDDPWFWKVTIYKESTHVNTQSRRVHTRPKARIQFDIPEHKSAYGLPTDTPPCPVSNREKSGALLALLHPVPDVEQGIHRDIDVIHSPLSAPPDIYGANAAKGLPTKKKKTSSGPKNLSVKNPDLVIDDVDEVSMWNNV